MRCPRCEYKYCENCGNSGYWEKEIIYCEKCNKPYDQKAYRCPSCKKIACAYREFNENIPCVACNYPYPADTSKTLEQHVQEVTNHLSEGNITYGRGLLVLKTAAKKLISRGF